MDRKSFLDFYVGLLAKDGENVVTAMIDAREWSGFYKRYDQWNNERLDNLADGLIDPDPKWSVYGYEQAWQHAEEYVMENPKDAERVVVVRTETFTKNWESFSSYAAVLGSVGGKSRSDAKRKASAENGKKGGRPKKIQE